MHWFKHMSNARSNKKVKFIIRKWGARGYGLVFLLYEIVANLGGTGADFNPELDLKQPDTDTEYLAHEMLLRNTKELTEVLSEFAHRRIIDPEKWKRKVVSIPKLKEYRDEYARTSKYRPGGKGKRADATEKVGSNSVADTKGVRRRYGDKRRGSVAATEGSVENTHREQSTEGRDRPSASETPKTSRSRSASYRKPGTERPHPSAQETLKELQAKTEANGNLQEFLTGGIHRSEMFKAFDDCSIGKLPLGDAAKEMLRVAVVTLSLNRSVELKGWDREQAGEELWRRLQGSLGLFEGIQNHDNRKHQLGGHIINMVVKNATDYLREQGRVA